MLKWAQECTFRRNGLLLTWLAIHQHTMFNKNFILFLVFAHTSFMLAAQDSALDKVFHVPSNFQQAQSQLDSLLAMEPLEGKEENRRLCMISKLYRESDPAKALEFAKNSMEKIEKTNDSSSLLNIYNIYANSLSVQGNFPAATRYFTKSQVILDKQRDTLSLAFKEISLAYSSTYGTIDGYERKQNHLIKSYELFKKVKDYSGMGGAAYGLASNIYYKVIDPVPISESEKPILLKQALRYSMLADSFYRMANMKDRRAAAIVSQGQIHHLMGKPKLAKSLIGKAYLIHKKENSYMGMQRCAWSMARLLETEQKLDSAIFFMQQSAILLEKANANFDLPDNFDYQTKLYKAIKNYPEALRTSELARKYREKSFTVNHLSEVESIKNSYENQIKDGKISELETETRLQESKAKQQMQLAISGLSILTIVIGLGTYSYYQRQKSINQMKENIKLGNLLKKNLEDKLQDTQLAALKAQMNPHFVGNAISAVQSLILQEKKEDALHYLNDFSKLTRHALENSKKETISLAEEVEFLGHYFHLEQLRYPNTLDFKITIDPSIDDPSFERIPPMMVQPFVENAIKHGLHHKNEKGFVNVSFHLADAGLLCTIEDNGVGRAAAALLGQQQRTSHSTAITDARLELLQQKADHQHKYKIQIEDLFKEGKVTGTKVVITIPTGSNVLITG